MTLALQRLAETENEDTRRMQNVNSEIAKEDDVNTSPVATISPHAPLPKDRRRQRVFATGFEEVAKDDGAGEPEVEEVKENVRNESREPARQRPRRVFAVGFDGGSSLADESPVGGQPDNNTGTGSRVRPKRTFHIGFSEVGAHQTTHTFTQDMQVDVKSEDPHPDGATPGVIHHQATKAERRAKRRFQQGYVTEDFTDNLGTTSDAPSGLPAARRQRHFAQGFTEPGPPADVPTEHAEPRAFRSIEDSPVSSAAPTLHEVVDDIIQDIHPFDRKPHIYVPPPEARNLMVRNICERHNKAPHPLEGYLVQEDPSRMQLDSMQYPPDFLPPLECSYTEQQLREVHWKIKNANYNTSSYQDKLHFAKGARLTQLEWELNNVNVLSAVSKELEELQNELIAWQG